jgi:predicted amidohydrolase YtcJ
MQVYVDGIVRTCTGPGITAEAIAIEDGKIVAVGTRAEVLARAGANAEAVSLEGRALLPGFIDAHHHLTLFALLYGAVECSPSLAKDIPTLCARLAAEAKRLPPGAWVVGHGYHELELAEGRHPAREELDAACPDHPVFLYHYSCHEGLASTRALELAGIDRETPDPPAGRIERDRNRLPTGRLVETAISAVETRARADRIKRDDGLVGRIIRAQEGLFAAGITRICDPTVPSDLAAVYRAARATGEFVLPVVMMPVSDAGYLVPPFDCLETVRTGEGPEDLRVGPLKVFMDGANNCALCISPLQLVSSVAATIGRVLTRRSLAPIRLAGQTQLRFENGALHAGILFLPPPRIRELVARANERGITLAIHAEGNEAVSIAAEAITASGSRHRIEHCTFLTQENVAQLRDGGITAVVQPCFTRLPAIDDVPVLPGMTMLPLRSMLDAGIRIAGSSDAPVTTYDVLAAARAATERTTSSGRPIFPEQSVTVEEVITMYTREAAAACGCLDVTGTLEEGKRADLVVLSKDPCAPDARLDEVRVERTVLKGRTVFERQKE